MHSAFIVNLPSLLNRPSIQSPPSCRSYRRTLPKASVNSQLPPRNAIPASAYLVYMSHLFLAHPTGPLTPLPSLLEAAKLSFNFIYITPLLFPSISPSLHPMLEAIFNIVVAWALLLLSFISEDYPKQSSRSRSPPATPFLIATAFLTNIFYLPYIALHIPNETPLKAIPASQKSPLISFSESRALPILSLSMLLSSIPWAIFARPSYGPFPERLASFLQLLNTDILAHSFAVDILVFSIFQAWLVRSDASRRSWKHSSSRHVNAAFIPFFGLAWYIWTRASEAPIHWSDDPHTL